MIPVRLGKDIQTQENVYLSPDVLRTHMHLVGATGSGKSTALLTMLQQLILQTGSDKCCLFLIDPLGNLSRDLLRFIAHPVFATDFIRDRLVYIEPANNEYVVPFNPLASTDDNRYYQVMRAVDIVLRAWDAQEVRQQPRLLQWTFKAFCTVAILGFPIAICAYILHPGTDEHRALFSRLPSSLKNEWQELLSARGSEPTRILESTRNRLDPFFKSDHLRRMFGTRTHQFDCERFIRERKIVVLNLGRYGRLSDFIADTIGSLALNEILETASRLSTSYGRQTVEPTYVVMDEFQRFVGKDVEQAIPTIRQMGLRLILAHQSFSQLEKEDVDLTNMIWQARSRLIFANSARDADLLADELGKFTFDNMTIKDKRTTVRQIITGYRREWMHSENSSAGRSTGNSENESFGYGRSTSETSAPRDSRTTKGKGTSDNKGHGTSRTTSDTSSQAYGRSETNVPIHDTFDEVSSITYLNFEEWALKWGKDIRRLRTGQAFATFPDQPDIRPLHIDEFTVEESPKTRQAIDELLARNYESEFFITATEADRELEDCRRSLLASASILPSDGKRLDAPSDQRTSDPPDASPFR